MTIVANFTANVTSGARPLTIAFSDTSLGSPTSWLWDFGDGQTSEDQNPVHIYTEDGTFTVRLRAYIVSGTTSLFPSEDTALRKEGTGSTNITAHNNFISNSYVNTDPFENNTYNVDRPSGSVYNYFHRKVTYDLNLTSHSGKIIVLLAAFSSGVIIDSSGAKSPYGGFLAPGNTDLHPIGDLTSQGGSNINFEILDLSDNGILLDPPSADSSGWAVNILTGRAFATSEQDTETKIDFINVGIVIDPPVAAFSGTPRKKLDSLTSQFTDESRNAPTSWSWKRRPSGIKAPYIEFSTDENPSEDFDITVP